MLLHSYRVCIRNTLVEFAPPSGESPTDKLKGYSSGFKIEKDRGIVKKFYLSFRQRFHFGTNDKIDPNFILFLIDDGQ